MAMSVTSAVASRYSCRAFQPDKAVDEGLLRELLTKASRAASDGNTQPWQLYVLNGEAKISLSNAVQSSDIASAVSEYHNYPDQDSTGGVVCYDDEALTEKTQERMKNFRKTKYSTRSVSISLSPY